MEIEFILNVEISIIDDNEYKNQAMCKKRKQSELSQFTVVY